MSDRYFFETHNGSFKSADPRVIQYRLLDCATVRSVFYAAVEITEPDKDRKFVTAFVFMLKRVPKAADGFNFGWKDLTESCGPYATDAPAKILDLLTPVEEIWPDPESSSHKYAAQWRERCRKGIDIRKRRPRLKAGDKLTFVNKLRFTTGAEHRVFVLHNPKTYLCTVGKKVGPHVYLNRRTLANPDAYTVRRKGKVIHAPQG
jgi:hypothetical protein